jgi:ribosomal protein L19
MDGKCNHNIKIVLGSILAVSSSNQHAPEKLSHFVGICIQRGGCGLRAFFILRNVIDHQGSMTDTVLTYSGQSGIVNCSRNYCANIQKHVFSPQHHI